MRVNFRIGDVFPPDDAVSQFLTGLCLVVNDVTLVMRHMDRIKETPEGKSRINTYYLYLTCAYYREAARFLQMWLDNEEVEEFLRSLTPAGQDHLNTVRSSFTPVGRLVCAAQSQADSGRGFSLQATLPRSDRVPSREGVG